VRDCKKEVVARKNMIKLGNLEPAAAEALSALYLVKFCKDLGLCFIIME
jgi:hypothetical protein